MDENRKWYLYLPQNISAPTNTNGGVRPHTAVRWHKNTSLNACAQQVNAAHAWTLQSLKWRNKSHFPLVVPTNSNKGLSGTFTEIQCCFFFPLFQETSNIPHFKAFIQYKEAIPENSWKWNFCPSTLRMVALQVKPTTLFAIHLFHWMMTKSQLILAYLKIQEGKSHKTNFYCVLQSKLGRCIRIVPV